MHIEYSFNHPNWMKELYDTYRSNVYRSTVIDNISERVKLFYWSIVMEKSLDI